MDGSFLSVAEVIDESRKFVCIRLATYENKEEAELLKTIFIGRSGELENTTFAILSPDGKRQLVRSGRSPDFAFSGPEVFAIDSMVRTMRRISDQYESRGKAGDELPVLSDVRLALNVAACDNQPLVVLHSSNKDELAALEARMNKLAWSNDFIGQFLYVTSSSSKELAKIAGVKSDSGIIVVEPGTFGVDGEVLAHLKPDADEQSLKEALSLSVVLHERVDKESSSHIRLGTRLGVRWQTLLPVTDPGGPGGGRGSSGRGRPPGRPR